MKPFVLRETETGPIRAHGLGADGNSVCTVMNAAGRVIATIDPFTRERTDARSGAVSISDKLSPRDAFVAELLRHRPKASTAEWVKPKKAPPRSYR
jgi:hypothetical protein